MWASVSGIAVILMTIGGGDYTLLHRGVGEHRNDQLGNAVTLGDWNNDGADDLAVSAWQAAEAAGVIQIIYASAGFPGEIHGGLVAGATRGSFTGYSMYGLDDINGDGIDDLLLGAHLRDPPSVVQVHFGSPEGLSFEPDLILQGGLTRDFFGYSVTAYDANRDGWKDVIVGADDGGKKWAGAVWIFNGGPSFDADPDLVISGHWRSTANLGSGVCPVGDVNDGGFADLAIADHDVQAIWTDKRGRVFVVTGTRDGGGKLVGTLHGPSEGSRFGWSLAGLGDWDVDGVSDFIVGAPRHRANGFGWAGQVTLYRGREGLGDEHGETLEGSVQYSRLGQAVWGGVDVTGDRRPDLLVSEPGAADERGKVHIFPGMRGASLTFPAMLSIEGGESQAEWGYAIAGGMDLDRDGLKEICVTAPRSDIGAVDGGGFEIWEFPSDTD